MKVSTLEGALLDAAVARLDGWTPVDLGAARSAALTTWERGGVYEVAGHLDFSADWALGGPIIERERIDVLSTSTDGWAAKAGAGPSVSGPTPLVAAMRAFVSAKLGEEIDLP